METNLAEAYRQSRRNFIANCHRAGADAIARVHPVKGPDGRPLFCDSAAFGPRDAGRALLLIEEDGTASRLVGRDLALPPGTRLVVVHALDPFARAWGRPGEPWDWPQKTLAAIAGEDLSRVKALAVAGGETEALNAALVSALPETAITFLGSADQAAVSAAIAAL